MVLEKRTESFVELSVGTAEFFLEFEHFGEKMVEKILLVRSFGKVRQKVMEVNIE